METKLEMIRPDVVTGAGGSMWGEGLGVTHCSPARIQASVGGGHGKEQQWCALQGRRQLREGAKLPGITQRRAVAQL